MTEGLDLGDDPLVLPGVHRRAIDGLGPVGEGLPQTGEKRTAEGPLRHRGDDRVDFEELRRLRQADGVVAQVLDRLGADRERHLALVVDQDQGVIVGIEQLVGCQSGIVVGVLRQGRHAHQRQHQAEGEGHDGSHLLSPWFC